MGPETSGSQPLLLVVTGVPGSGKTTIGASLATALDVPFISLDVLKAELYDRCVAGPDRHALRLAAEQELADRLNRAEGSFVVDIWIAPGRDTERVAALLKHQGKPVVEVLCRVPAEIAVARYARRRRDGPHLPADEPTLQRIREAADVLVPLGIGRCIEVDTSRRVDLIALFDQLTGM